MNKEFVWTDKLFADFQEWIPKQPHERWVNYSWLIEQFKASHSTDRGWEILKGKHCNGGVHAWNSKTTGVSCELMGCRIYSVRRNSDGEIFSVGDEVNVLCDDNKGFKETIIGFYVDDKNKLSLVEFKDTPSRININWLDDASKLPKRTVLLKTDDGVSLYNESDVYWRVYDDWSIGAFKVFDSVSHSVVATFSSEGKAKEYVILNKPCLSIKDFKDTFVNRDFVGTDYAVEKLKELVKSKQTNL